MSAFHIVMIVFSALTLLIGMIKLMIEIAELSNKGK